MRFYLYKEDWITHLDGEFRDEILRTLRNLSINRLQKYPPPKINGLPLGNETRVLSRLLKGQSSQLDASALSGFYRSMLSAEDKLLYRAFRMNEALPHGEWSEIIGTENIARWIENKCLKQSVDGSLKCEFSVIGLDGLVFCVDPLRDHGSTWEPDFLTNENPNDDENVRPFFHTYIGLDSLQMIEHMDRETLPRGGRYLDCGPGAGGLLIYFGRRFDESIGVDISPRAAKLAGFNATLNDLAHCKTFCDDAIKMGEKYGRFDLVSWNLPFIFMPEEHKDVFVDGFGGEMGIGLCLEFIETVPGLLADKGLACVAALAPILDSGENVLEGQLKERLARLGLDCTLKVAQVSLAHNRELWDFHRSHNIRKFEAVYLYLKAGTGRLDRVEAPASRQLIDKLREKMYARKFA